MTGKRFTKVSSEGYWKIKDSQADYKEIWDLTNPQLIEDRLNQLNNENEQLKEELQQYKDKHKKWVGECEELHKDFEKDWKRWGRM